MQQSKRFHTYFRSLLRPVPPSLPPSIVLSLPLFMSNKISAGGEERLTRQTRDSNGAARLMGGSLPEPGNVSRALAVDALLCRKKEANEVSAQFFLSVSLFPAARRVPICKHLGPEEPLLLTLSMPRVCAPLGGRVPGS